MKKKTRGKRGRKSNAAVRAYSSGVSHESRIVAAVGPALAKSEGATFAHQFLLDWNGSAKRQIDSVGNVSGPISGKVGGIKYIAGLAPSDRDARQAALVREFYEEKGRELVDRLAARDVAFFSDVGSELYARHTDGRLREMWDPLRAGIIQRISEVRQSVPGAKFSPTLMQAWLRDVWGHAAELRTIRAALRDLGVPVDSRPGRTRDGKRREY